jgi:hypothetical protein
MRAVAIIGSVLCHIRAFQRTPDPFRRPANRVFSSQGGQGAEKNSVQIDHEKRSKYNDIHS